MGYRLRVSAEELETDSTARKISRRLRAYAYNSGARHDHDIDDAVQDAWVRALPKTRTGGIGDIFGYIARTVVNAVRSIGRREQKRKVRFAYEHEVADPENPNLLSKIAGEDEQHTYLKDQLKAMVAELTPKQREVIELRYYAGLSYQQISEVLDVPKGTVSTRIYHAKKRLKEKAKEKKLIGLL